MTGLLKTFAHVACGTLLLVVADWLLGISAFDAQGLNLLLLPLGLAAVSMVIWMVIVATVATALSYKNLGLVLNSLIGIVAGSVTLWLAANYFPQLVLLDSLLAYGVAALINTTIINTLGFITGTLKTDSVSLTPTS
jgi:hypothetical protein